MVASEFCSFYSLNTQRKTIEGPSQWGSSFVLVKSCTARVEVGIRDLFRLLQTTLIFRRGASSEVCFVPKRGVLGIAAVSLFRGREPRGVGAEGYCKFMTFGLLSGYSRPPDSSRYIFGSGSSLVLISEFLSKVQMQACLLIIKQEKK